MTNHEQEHMTVEQLGDLLDGRLSPSEEQAIETHLAMCTSCAEQRERLALLVGAARALPQEIEPPTAIWDSVHTRIAPSRTSVRPWWQLAVAAVILVAISSAVTALIVRRPTVLVVREVPPPFVSASAVVPSPLRSVDADYAAAIHELDESLTENRDRIDPATLTKVEASLRIIDTAIGEIRRALAADPANLTLVDILAANYERKLELLRRASALSPSI